MDHQPRTILLIEDHADSAKAMAMLLEIDGHCVDVASTFADAQQKATEHDYDAIFCDIDLPDGSGLDLPLLVKSKSPGTRMIAMTGHGMSFELQAMRDAGFDAQLLKPITTELLQEYAA